MSKRRLIQQIEDEVRLPTIIEELPSAKKGIREGTKLLPGARLINITRIKPDPQQARKTINRVKIEELAQSIRKKGILQPLTVDYIEQEDCFRIITGYRRWLAAKIAKVNELPCIIRQETEIEKGERWEQQLIENLQREDLNPIEEAETYKQLIELRGYKQKDLAEKIGKSKSYISESLALLNKLKKEEIEKVRTSELLSKSLLREALRTKDEKLRKAILNGKFTVREARAKIKSESLPRGKNYEYRYKAENGSFLVIVKFKKQNVEQDEILKALEMASCSIRKNGRKEQ